MKRFTLALALVAALSLSACATAGNWSPECSDRTAGKCEKSAKKSKKHKADKAFNKAMRK